MSDQEQARRLAEIQLPFLITDTEDLRRVQEAEPKNEAAIQWEAQLPGLFDDLVPRGPSHDDSLSQAATIYFGATTLLSPLIEEAAARHLARRKEKEIELDSTAAPQTGGSKIPDIE